MWLAQDDSTLFLGQDFFPWMILAFGAAMVVGNVLALARPPEQRSGNGDGGGDRRPPGEGSDDLARPPIARSVVMIVVGLAAATWSVATLLA